MAGRSNKPSRKRKQLFKNWFWQLIGCFFYQVKIRFDRIDSIKLKLGNLVLICLNLFSCCFSGLMLLLAHKNLGHPPCPATESAKTYTCQNLTGYIGKIGAIFPHFLKGLGGIISFLSEKSLP